MSKHTYTIISLFIVLLLLTGCSTGGQPQSAPLQDAPAATPLYEWGKVTGKTITIWGDAGDLGRPYNTREFERYAELTGNTLNVVALSKEELNRKVPAVFASDTTERPDILVGYGGTNIENLNPDENFYDFSDAPWIDDLSDTSMGGAVYNRRIIGLPHGEASVSGMLYHKEIFKKHEINLPTTQQEFLEVCETLLQNRIIPVYLPYQEASMLLCQIPMDTFLQDEKTLNGLNDGSLSYSDIPAMRDMLEWYGIMAEKGYFGTDYEKNDWNGMDGEFQSGKYAMMTCWDTWLYTDFSGDPSEIGLMPTFMGTPEKGCFEGANVLLFMVDQKSADLDVSLDFINYLADPCNYNIAYEGIYTAPVYNHQSGSITTPQYMEVERNLLDELFYPSTTWSRLRGYAQIDAAHIRGYMKGEYSAEQCLENMEAARRERAGL